MHINITYSAKLITTKNKENFDIFNMAIDTSFKRNNRGGYTALCKVTELSRNDRLTHH